MSEKSKKAIPITIIAIGILLLTAELIFPALHTAKITLFLAILFVSIFLVGKYLTRNKTTTTKAP